MILVILLIVFFIILLLVVSKKKNVREGYRDPIYLNRAKYAYEYYPRANGSIYGFPYSQGGSWSVLSGFPFYDRAY